MRLRDPDHHLQLAQQALPVRLLRHGQGPAQVHGSVSSLSTNFLRITAQAYSFQCHFLRVTATSQTDTVLCGGCPNFTKWVVDVNERVKHDGL